MARHAQAPCLRLGEDPPWWRLCRVVARSSSSNQPSATEIQGFLINKFRGDRTLLGDINDWFQEKAFGVPTLGVIPYIPDLQIADEDAVSLYAPAVATASMPDAIDIAVIPSPISPTSMNLRR